MKRTIFTFAPHYPGRHRLGIQPVKINRDNSLQQKAVRKLRSYWQKTLQPATLCKAGAAFSAALAFGISAQAQCHNFVNADAANLIKSQLKGSEEIYGLDFVDIDGDGDLDCYAKIYSDETYIPAIPILFRNVGTSTSPAFVRDANTGFATKDDGFYTFGDIQFADMDGDGDFDCFIGESYTFGGTTIHYYENQGTPTQPKFVENEAKNPVGFAYAFYGITFAIADIDGDGDYDFSYATDFGRYQEEVYFNRGTKTQPNLQLYSSSFETPLTRVYYDWNKDGLLDYFDNAYTDLEYYRNIGPRLAPKYVLDNTTGPSFGNGIPYRFVDLNGDGAPEVFNFNGGMSTLAPVPLVKAKQVTRGGFLFVLLSSTSQAPSYKYQWKLNGVELKNATKPFYPAYKNGFYTLAITDTCGTGLSLPYRVQSSFTASAGSAFIATGVPSLNKAAIIRAYPNPFPATVTVSLPPSNGEVSLVKVLDLAGRTILSQQTDDATITLGNTLKSGVYLLQVWQKGGLVFTQKLVKE